MTPVDWNAIVLAGGRASRLGGIDKSQLLFDGKSLLDHALRSVEGAKAVVVVGDADIAVANPAVQVVSESPRYSGPAAAAIAGLTALSRPRARWTVVIAADLPYAPAALQRVLAALEDHPHVGGVIAQDESGRSQPLLAVYSTAALALAGAEAGPALEGMSMKALVSPIWLYPVTVPSALCADIDTPLDAAAHGIAITRELEAGHARG